MILPVLTLIAAAPSDAQQATAGDLRVVQEGSVIRALYQGKPAFTYVFSADSPKPYINPLATPAGHDVTRMGPADHLHHRGLMFALGNVAFAGEADHVVFWGEQGDPPHLGHIIHMPGSEMLLAEDLDPADVAIASRLEWRRLSDNALMLSETRRITLFDPAATPGAYVLTWESQLTAPDRDIVLGGTPGSAVSYYGLGLRVPQDMDGGQIVDANGKAGEQAVNGDDARWCAYTGPKEPVRGFAMFDHPTNVRYPTGWFVMSAGFGYMTASIVCHQPYTLPARQTLRLRYGVCAYDGAPTAEDLDALYRRWLEFER
jgi:Family of unknown function (DUF6807)